MNIREALKDPAKKSHGFDLFYAFKKAYYKLDTAPRKIVLVAYLMYKIKYMHVSEVSYGEELFQRLEIPERIKNFLLENIEEDTWEAVKYLLDKYTEEDFALGVFAEREIEPYYRGMIFAESESINKLACRLLNIEEGDKVADLCSGIGTFITDCITEGFDAEYTGYEVSEEAYILAEIRAELLGKKVNFYRQDMLSINPSAIGAKYNKIIAEYPLGMKVKDMKEDTVYLQYFKRVHPEISKVVDLDWIFNSLMCELLEENGKAIGITTVGYLFNTHEIAIREYFIAQGLIECVIALPQGILYGNTCPPVMIVFSHRKNNEVRFVNAKNIYKKGCRGNELTDENVEEIIKAVENDTLYSRKVSLEKIRENNYSLNVGWYLVNEHEENLNR